MPDLLKIENKIWKKGIQYIAGVDEAGRGPLAGPVVAAAVIFESGNIPEGIRDSKALTSKQRETLFQEIRDSALSFGIGIILHDEIDRINILQATFAAMKMALANLNRKPEYIIVDGNLFPSYDVPVQTVIKGDALSTSIAAASILAKVTRDKIMTDYHLQYPDYGFDKHKGYCTREHIDAIKKFGYSAIHRKSFHVKQIEEPEFWD